MPIARKHGHWTGKFGQPNEGLVHGLTRKVDLKDWDFIFILTALDHYKKTAGLNASTLTNITQLQAKLRRPYADLVKQTKRENHRLLSKRKTNGLEEYLTPNP